MHTTVYVPASGEFDDARIFAQFTPHELQAMLVALRRYTDLAYYLVNDRRKEVENVAAGLTLALTKFQVEMAERATTDPKSQEDTDGAEGQG